MKLGSVDPPILFFSFNILYWLFCVFCHFIYTLESVFQHLQNIFLGFWWKLHWIYRLLWEELTSWLYWIVLDMNMDYLFIYLVIWFNSSELCNFCFSVDPFRPTLFGKWRRIHFLNVCLSMTQVPPLFFQGGSLRKGFYSSAPNIYSLRSSGGSGLEMKEGTKINFSFYIQLILITFSLFTLCICPSLYSQLTHIF